MIMTYPGPIWKARDHVCAVHDHTSAHQRLSMHLLFLSEWINRYLHWIGSQNDSQVQGARQWFWEERRKSDIENQKFITVYHPENSLWEHSTLFLDVPLRWKSSWILEIQQITPFSGSECIKNSFSLKNIFIDGGQEFFSNYHCF